MKMVAVTACPTGIAHTYMAAESLEKAARELGVEIKVETEGSVGAENALTPEDIASADVVIIAAATQVPKDRFAGKPILEVPIQDAIKNGKAVIERAMKLEKPAQMDYVQQVSKNERGKIRSPNWCLQTPHDGCVLHASLCGSWWHTDSLVLRFWHTCC